MDNQKQLRLLRFILAGTAFIAVFFAFLNPISDPDIFWHMATGRWIVENLSLPEQDPFNYTSPLQLGSRGHFILTSYWLSQVFYYGIYYVFGWSGLIFSRFVVLSAIIYFIYKRAQGSEKTILFSVMALAVSVFVKIYPFDRPQVFSFIFFAMLLYVLENLKEACSEQRAAVSVKERKSVHAIRYTLLPLLMLIWANMHGGYILGQAVILVYILSEGLKFIHPALNPMKKSAYMKFLFIGILSLLSALINPNAYGAITEMLALSKYSSLIGISEYQSTILVFRNFGNFAMPLYWLLLLMAVASLFYMGRKKRVEMRDLVMLAGLGYFSFTQVRYIAFFLIWSAPFISSALTGFADSFTREPDGKGNTIKNNDVSMKPFKDLLLKYTCFFVSVFIVLFVVVKEKDFERIGNINYYFKKGYYINDDKYPAVAVNFILENNIKGRMFNHFGWGGYLIWRFYPEKRVFTDNRSLYMPNDAQNRFIIEAALKPEVGGMPYYKVILENYRISYMLIPFFSLTGEMLPLAPEMIKDKEWIPVFLHGNSMVFIKDAPENYRVIQMYSIPRDVFINSLFEMLDAKIRKSPRDSRLHIAKGDLYVAMSRLDKAREEYENVLAINPFSSLAMERLKYLDIAVRSKH